MNPNSNDGAAILSLYGCQVLASLSVNEVTAFVVAFTGLLNTGFLVWRGLQERKRKRSEDATRRIYRAPGATLRSVLFAAALGGVLASGCAVNRPVFSETTADGTRRELRVSSWALWPATVDLARQKASLGKTFTLGTDGLREDGGGTNVTESLRLLKAILHP